MEREKFFCRLVEKEVSGKKITTAELGGQACIESAGDVHSALADLFENKECTALDLNLLEKVDSTFFQLFFAFCKSLNKKERVFHLFPLKKNSIVLEATAILGIPRPTTDGWLNMAHIQTERDNAKDFNS